MKRPNYRLTVDTSKDLELICEIYSRLYHPGKIIPLKNAIKLLDENPYLLKVNNHIHEKNVQHKVNVKLHRQ